MSERELELGNQRNLLHCAFREEEVSVDTHNFYLIGAGASKVRPAKINHKYTTGHSTIQSTHLFWFRLMVFRLRSGNDIRLPPPRLLLKLFRLLWSLLFLRNPPRCCCLSNRKFCWFRGGSFGCFLSFFASCFRPSSSIIFLRKFSSVQLSNIWSPLSMRAFKFFNSPSVMPLFLPVDGTFLCEHAR